VAIPRELLEVTYRAWAVFGAGVAALGGETCCLLLEIAGRRSRSGYASDRRAWPAIALAFSAPPLVALLLGKLSVDSQNGAALRPQAALSEHWPR
jgi:hypothetical protein